MSKDSREILIVEGKELRLEYFRSLFHNLPYKTIITPNGMDGLQSLVDYLNTISLILLDIHVSGLDGFEFLELIRASPFLKHIPVILHTDAGSADIKKAMSLGADAWISKPCIRDDLLLAINKLEPKILAYEKSMKQSTDQRAQEPE